MAVMKAEPGYSALILIRNSDKEGWYEENVRRVPVIAWNITNDSFTTPITLMPWLNTSPEFVIETPEKSLIVFGREQRDAAQLFDSVAHYVEAIRQIISHAPPQPHETEVKH